MKRRIVVSESDDDVNDEVFGEKGDEDHESTDVIKESDPKPEEDQVKSTDESEVDPDVEEEAEAPEESVAGDPKAMEEDVEVSNNEGEEHSRDESNKEVDSL
ncbi:unnamed protein product [Rhodiola kirilowii]